MFIYLENEKRGTKQAIEVDDAFGEWYVNEQRKENNEQARYEYHVTVSLDTVEYEGEWFVDPSPTPEELSIIKEEQRRIEEFKKTLTPTQLRRLELLEEGISLREVARKEDTNLSAIQKTRDQIRKKYKKFISDQGGH